MIKIKENIKQMADLLKSGHTMLNIACPICNNPIFRKKDGTILCPTCNREVKLIENEESRIKTLSKDKNLKNDKDKNELFVNNNKVLVDLKRVILEKISFFTEKLKIETKIIMIDKYLVLLSSLCNLLKQLSTINN